MHAAHPLASLKSSFLAGLATLLLIGGGLFSAAPAAAQENTKTPAEILLEEIRSTPYANRAALKEKLRQAENRFTTNITEWNARKNQLPEKEKAAADVELKKLVQMREVLKQKIDTVEFAEEATWTSAKYDLYVALQNAITVHKKLMTWFGA